MILIKTNISKVIEVDTAMLKSLADNDKMLREAALSVLGLMRIRVFENGLDASNTPLGTYSPGYMVVRLGTYKNASVHVTRGVNKGQLKKTKKIGDAGVFTKGKHKGEVRPHYNVLQNNKIILSLTRQMQDDLKITGAIKTEKGYALGFTNGHNYDKSQWCEATYNKKGKIFSLSQQEIEQVNTTAENFVNNAIPG